MNAIAPKGWCPSLFEPMPAGDGLLVRVKPPGAVLTSAAARQLATAAARFGNGTIELTNRANLQVRGLATDGVAPFAEAIIAAGLADAEPARERRRAVIFPPLAGVDPSVACDAQAVAIAIEALLAGEPRLADLPPKFAVAVDGGGILPLGATGADITVVCTTEHIALIPAGARYAALLHNAVMAGEGPPSTTLQRQALQVVDGPPARTMRRRDKSGLTATGDAPAAVLRLALAFLALAGRAAPTSRRMRTLIAAHGAASLFAAAGLDAVQQPPPPSPPRAIGWLPYSGDLHGAFGIGLPFGATTAATLARLGDLAEQFGDATLRLTPWRALALPGIAARDVPAVSAAAIRLGLIVDASDPRSTIVTCAGRPGCTSASVDVRADAALLLELRLPGRIHMSGCAKGCAHPAPAPITLVGDNGNYSIIRNGRAGDAPSMRRLTMAEAVAVLRVTEA